MCKTLDVDQMLEMIDQAQKKQKKTLKTPASFVAQLKAGPDLETLRSLRVYLTTESVDWLKTFRDCQGLAALTGVLTTLERERTQSDNTKECILECCSIVEAVAHSTEGMRMVMDPQADQLVKVLILALDTSDTRRLAVLYDFFSLLCLFSPQYYEKTIECFSYYKVVKREPVLYYNLVQTLRNAQTKEVAAKCLTLINALICTPDDLDARATQRNNFLRLGIREVLLAVRQRISDDLFVVQFNLFFDDEKEDQQQLKEITGLTAVSTTEGSDENLLFKNLVNNTKSSEMLSASLQSILESLSNLPTNAKEKTTGQLWGLAASLMQQVAAGKSFVPLKDDVVIDTASLMSQMDYRAELMLKEKDWRAIEQELRTQLKKTTSELSDTKQELSFLKERGGSSTAVLNTPLVRPKDKVFSKEQESSDEEFDEEARMAKHRLQDEEVFRLKQKLNETGSLKDITSEAEAAKIKAEAEVRVLKEENARLAAQLVSMKADFESESRRAARATMQLSASVLPSDVATESSAPPPPPPPGGGPPPPPPPPGGGPPPPPPPPGDFGGPPPPPPPPGGGPPPPPPPPGGGPPPPPPPPGGGPPPPPPPPGGGPPPPPPPGGGPPGPPPPPGAPKIGGPGLAPAAKQWESPLPKPEVKMRIVNWTKIPNNKAQATLFNKMKDEITAVDLDFKEVQDLFRVPDDTAKPAAAATPAGPVLVSLIGPKRTQSVNIFLKSCRMSAEDIIIALEKFDQNICTQEFLEKLLDNIPTQEEMASIDAYEEGGGKEDMLAEPERFFRKISTVKALKLRVQAFITYKKFPVQRDGLRPQIESVSGAIAEVRESEKWKGIIRFVLALGNYINGTSTRGNAIGFKLDSLNKLRDTKTADNKSNLLNYVVQALEKKDAKLLTVAEELKDVGAGMRVTFPSLLEEIQGLTKSVANIEAAITGVASSDPNDQFSRYITPEVVSKFRSELNKLVDDITKAEKEYKELAASYGEDPATLPSSDFLQIIDTFLTSLHNARKEILAERAKQEKKENLIRSQQAKQPGLTAGQAEAQADVILKQEAVQNKAGVKQAAPGQALVVDELLQGLKSGALLRNRTETRREERIRRTPQMGRKEVDEPQAPPWALKKAGNAPTGPMPMARSPSVKGGVTMASSPPAKAPMAPVVTETTVELGEVSAEIGEEVAPTLPDLPPMPVAKPIPPARGNSTLTAEEARRRLAGNLTASKEESSDSDLSDSGD